MKDILNSLYNYRTLEEAEATKALHQLATGNCTEAQISGFLSAYIMRRPSIDELKGFRNAMLRLCRPLTLNAENAIDIVGTGGDGKNSFNISTLTAFVVAAAGYKVIKHGNYGATSVSGSSNVLEHLGYRFTNSQGVLQQQLDDAGICFLHAPLFHPAMKHLSSIRKNIGVRTFFNLLGPLLNPAQPTSKLLGVNSLETARIYKYLLQDTEQPYCIVHSLDGYDEISLTGAFKVATQNTEDIFQPEDIGLAPVSPIDITAGNSVKDAVKIFADIIKGNGTKAQNEVLVANSAFAIQCIDPGMSIEDCIEQSREALVSGATYKIFQQTIQ